LNRSQPGRDNQRAATEASARTLATGAEALTTAAATLQSGGWELQAARAPVGQLPQPANFVATGGDLEGTVDLSWDAIRRGVQTYIAQQALSPSGPDAMLRRQSLELHRHRPDQRHAILVPGQRHRRRRPHHLERPCHQTGHLSGAQEVVRAGLR
jgi:hypothetical protein